MKKIMLVLCAGLAAIPLLAQNVKVEMTGPSGQGDFQIKSAADGTVLFKVGTNGIVTFVGADGAAFSFGGISVGEQTEALGTNESATVPIVSAQASITGPTNADTAVVTLVAPSSAQLGQSVVVYNAGTNTLSIVYTAGSTNDVATAGLMLIHAASTNGWSYLEIPALDSELTLLSIKDAKNQTNINATAISSGNLAQERMTNALATAGSKIGGNIPASALTSAVPAKVMLNDLSSGTNLNPATAFPDYAVCVVTNLDGDGTTNIITFIGTKSVLGE